MNKFEGAELNIYTTNGRNISIDLSPTQLMSICGILKIEYDDVNDSISCLSDESLIEFYKKTVGRFK